MRPTLRRVAVAGACAALLALAGCGESALEPAGSSAPGGEDSIVFAAVPSEESTSLQQSYASVIAMLERETGTTIEFQNATDYAAVIEGMRAGQIDVAVFGPFSYVLAKGQDPDITPVAASVDAPGEEPGYQSYGITAADSGITDLAGFAGRNVCFVDPNSTSGYLYPSAGLIEAGVDPAAGVTPVFAGGHDASALAVASGQCDAGFAYDTIVDVQLLESGQLQPGQLRTVWRSETIAGSPVAVAGGVDPQRRQAIADAFAQKANVDYLTANGFCADAAGCEVGEEGGWGYVPVDDALYDGVRRVCEITQAESCTSLG
ncbi:phosphate/phosphite/phosphonate ABC transporter substrate-binding protein [Pseudonocardia sp. MH-G8]|uniref:phosphate/phosphite/phosphonate ABC transporter substrate-binding protein n=1 Tax=Pseudonocardia sp. MH-G8 TaxID=1854588 RepID=UPI000BA11F11|nr:phosphate/phosphite/phosphonate ABC transporter substrate-binding protein [Pseudonocardia sp. MH-G8]OZM76152.1 phosphate starvation-inducible protein PhoH [Pseudonocardia sp. MH-G8]